MESWNIPEETIVSYWLVCFKIRFSTREKLIGFSFSVYMCVSKCACMCVCLNRYEKTTKKHDNYQKSLDCT